MLNLLAYMDPGTGSLFLQLLLGGVAGAALIVKLYWHRLLTMVGVKKPEPASDEKDGIDSSSSQR